MVEGTREIDFTEITPGIMPITQDLAIFTRRLKAILGEEQKDDIRGTLSSINSLANELDSIVKDLHSLVVVKDDRNNIEEFFSNLNSASDKLDNIAANIDDITSENKNQISSILNNFSKSSESFSTSAQKLNNILDRIDNGEGSLGKLIIDDELANNMNGFVDDLRLIVEDVYENFDDYVKKYLRAKNKVKKEK